MKLLKKRINRTWNKFVETVAETRRKQPRRRVSRNWRLRLWLVFCLVHLFHAPPPTTLRSHTILFDSSGCGGLHHRRGSSSIQTPPLGVITIEFGSTRSGEVVFGDNRKRKLISSIASPTFVCINPNRNPGKISIMTTIFLPGFRGVYYRCRLEVPRRTGDM